MKPKSLLAVLALLLVLGGLALAGGGGPSLDWYVIGSGGGPVASGQVDLDATIGQAVAGTTSAGGYSLCSGYWCGAADRHTVYLPLVLKSVP
jgi:hypothetical protein